MPALGIFERYLVRRALEHAAVACGAGLLLYALVDAVELTNRLGARAGPDWAELFALALWSTPRVLRLVLGFATLLGVLTAALTLARRGELAALFASGGSPSVVLKATLVVGVALGTLDAVLTEWVVPPAEARVAQLRGHLGLPVRRRELLSEPSAWFRGSNRFFRVQDLGAADGSVLMGVLMLRVEKGRLIDRWDAGRLDYDGSGWTATDLHHRHFGDRVGIERAHHASARVALRERPSDFVRRVGLASRQQLTALVDTIEARTRLGQSTIGHRLELGRRLASPLVVVLSAVLAAALALHLGRARAGIGTALACGAGVGLAIWVLEELAHALATSEALSPEASAGAVPLALFLGFTLLTSSGALTRSWHTLR